MNLTKISTQSTNVQNYNCIDLGKFICSILVVMIHVAPFGESSGETVINYLNYGIQNYLARIAVPFFFVCSGFFLYKKTTLDNFSVEPTKRYAIRLLKLYIIWSLIYFPFSLKDFFKDDKGVLHGIIIYIRNFIVYRSFEQLWYLNATIFAVILISFLLYKKVKPLKITIIASVFYLIGLLAQTWFGLIKPLQEKAPQLWSLLKLAKKVIVTTRDGLFDGFIFVSLGMLFAFYDIKISKKSSLIGFIISMLLMFVEAFVLKYIDFVKERDMYLLLLFATFFGFSFVRQVELSDNTVYKKLRILSSLIFYIHLWIYKVINKLSIIYEPLSNIKFIVTLVITIIISLLIMKLSEIKKFQWLKKLYT